MGLTFEGRPHSGLADAKNTAYMALEMIRRGTRLRVTGWLKAPGVEPSKPAFPKRRKKPVSKSKSVWKVHFLYLTIRLSTMFILYYGTIRPPQSGRVSIALIENRLSGTTWALIIKSRVGPQLFRDQFRKDAHLPKVGLSQSGTEVNPPSSTWMTIITMEKISKRLLLFNWCNQYFLCILLLQISHWAECEQYQNSYGLWNDQY